MTALATPAPSLDQHSARYTPLPTPGDLLAELPLESEDAARIAEHRDAVRAVLEGTDDRLLVVVGPCSIHDPEAGLDYARRLAGIQDEVADDLLLVMRTYFEKPRTTVGWKGLINDPHLIGSRNSVAHGRPSAVTSRRKPRARRRPVAMSWEPFRCGSLIRPFQPTVVRGFTK